MCSIKQQREKPYIPYIAKSEKSTRCRFDETSENSTTPYRIVHNGVVPHHHAHPHHANKMANQSTKSNSPDYFKLLDDIDTFSSSDGTSNNDNNVLNPNGNFLFANYDFNGNGSIVGSNNSGTIAGATPSTTASFSSKLSTITNQSLEYQFDYGTHSNDSVKQNYEAGSNFMLLLEDFGEYFYNYNGSNDVGGGISSNGSNSNTGFESQTNCSIANSTCADNPGECWGVGVLLITSSSVCACESIANHAADT